MKTPITIALSKGRILEDTLPLLEKVGISLIDKPDSTRKLILDTNHEHIKVLALRATDVPTFVAQGAADIGVAGKDVLLEHGAENLYELIDLQIAKCKLMVAGHAGGKLNLDGSRRATVATKYVKSAQQFFAKKGRQVNIVKLYGSMELAPLVGMADYIVDVVDTGNTLRANKLEPFEHITDISSRLIANKAAMKIKHAALDPLVKQLEEMVA